MFICRLRSWLVVSLASVSAVSVGCSVDDASVINQANDAHRQLEPAVIEDPVLAGYVQQIGDRIVAAARERIRAGYERETVGLQDPEWMFSDVRFHLVNSDTLNAFTTGGQHVYLYTELFRQSKTEDEFAAVVAHEFAHIVGRHVHGGMKRQYTTLGAVVGAGVLGYALGGDDREQIAMLAAGGAMVGGQFLGAGFSRDDEDEADKFGFHFYVHAGYDPDRFGDFFRSMIALGYDTSDPMASHPQLSKRVANAERRAQEWKAQHPDWRQYLQPPVVGPARFRELQERAARVGKSMPSDKSLEAAQLMLAAFPSCVAPVPQESQVEAREEIGELLQDATAEQ